MWTKALAVSRRRAKMFNKLSARAGEIEARHVIRHTIGSVVVVGIINKSSLQFCTFLSSFLTYSSRRYSTFRRGACATRTITTILTLRLRFIFGRRLHCMWIKLGDRVTRHDYGFGQCYEPFQRFDWLLEWCMGGAINNDRSRFDLEEVFFRRWVLMRDLIVFVR